MDTQQAKTPDTPISPRMTPEQVNTYLESLLGKEPPALEGLEATVAEKFRAAMGRRGQLTQQHAQVVAQERQTRDELKRLEGEIDSYATILVSAQTPRQAKAQEPPATPPAEPAGPARGKGRPGRKGS